MLFKRSLQSISRNSLVAISRRGMAGGHHKEYVPTGKIDAIIRGVLKEDHQLAMGILAFYGILIIYATSGKKKEAAPVVAQVSHSDSGDIPSVDSPAFGDWLSGEGNFEKLLTSAAN